MPLFPNPPLPPPLSSDVVVNGGLTVPRRALDRWSLPIGSALTHVVVVGDSVPQGTVVQPGFLGPAATAGYFDGFVNRLARALGTAFGGIRGAGFYGLWRAGANGGGFNYLNSASEWAFAGVWTQQAAAQALIPYKGAITASPGVGNVATFTLPNTVAARTVKDLQTFANQTTVAAGSNGVHTNTFAGAGSLTVASTAGWPAAGTFVVVGADGVWSVITYTAVDATHFLNCTLVDSPDLVLTTGMVVDNTRVISSASVAFSTATDRGQTVYGTNLVRNAALIAIASATSAVISIPATAAAAGGALGLLGRNMLPGGPVAAFELVWVDTSLSGTWSYSLDGGATWIDVPSVTPATPRLRRVLVNSPITTANGLKVRGASSAGVGVAFTFGGVVLYNVTNPTAAPGIMVHNMCRDGGTYNPVTGGGTNYGLLNPAGAADYLRILDNGGDPNQQSLQPTLVIALFTNDADLVELGTITLAQLQANVATLINRIVGYGDVLIVNPPEQKRTATSATQAACRAAVKAQCAASGVACLDIYDAWAAQSELGYTQCFADFLMNDGAHPSLEGHADIAGHVFRVLATLAV